MREPRQGRAAPGTPPAARPAWQRSSDLSPLLHPPPAAPTRWQSCLKGFARKSSDAGCEREAHGGCRRRGGVPRLCPRGSVLPDLPLRQGQGLAGNWGIAVNPAKFGACLRFASSHSTLGGREVQHLPGLALLLWAFWLPSTSGFVVLICFVLFS